MLYDEKLITYSILKFEDEHMSGLAVKGRKSFIQFLSNIPVNF